MGAFPKRWIRQLLGLKKSEKVASVVEEEKSSKTPAKIDKGVSENENVDTDFEDAKGQWEQDQSSATSTSHQAKSAAQPPEDKKEECDAEDGNSQPDDDMPASPRVQQDWKEEWDGSIYAKESNFQSAVDSPTSPEVESSDQLEQDSGEGWATPEVREVFDTDPDPSTSPQGQYEALLKERIESASRYVQRGWRGFLPQYGARAQLPMSEESAAILIQAIYRGFVAKRAYRALKGMNRLQDQLGGRILKRQTAIALRCIQALVKVQARSRAKHVLTAIEGQAVQRKLLQQLEHEAPVKKKTEAFTFNGWCNKKGSAGEIQARMQKRKEAAAKREKAKAYALARQWQPGGVRQQPQQSPQQPKPQPQSQQPQQQLQTATAVFPSDKCEWGWNWLERWVSVRPWETQLLVDTGFLDGIKSPKTERGASMDVPTSPLYSTDRRKSTSNIGSGKSSTRLSSSIKLPGDSGNPSPRKLASAQESKTPKPARPIAGSRSFSTPRERSNVSDNQDKKRLSLPGTMHGARLLAQTAINSPRNQSPRTPSPRVLSPRTPQRPGNPRTKPNASEVKTSKLSPLRSQ